MLEMRRLVLRLLEGEDTLGWAGYGWHPRARQRDGRADHEMSVFLRPSAHIMLSDI